MAGAGATGAGGGASDLTFDAIHAKRSERSGDADVQHSHQTRHARNDERRKSLTRQQDVIPITTIAKIVPTTPMMIII